jgi:phospholipid/cholesterol/gamma-HCH transport system substrate-binding protein
VPSQQQLKWSQLKVGLTVLFAALVLALLIFLMTGSAGPFTAKIRVRSYFDNASGLRVGAPVRLEGVDIGNVEAVRIIPNHGLTPV